MDTEEVLKLAKLYRDVTNERIDEYTFIQGIYKIVADEVGWMHTILDFEATPQEIEQAEEEVTISKYFEEE